MDIKDYSFCINVPSDQAKFVSERKGFLLDTNVFSDAGFSIEGAFYDFKRYVETGRDFFHRRFKEAINSNSLVCNSVKEFLSNRDNVYLTREIFEELLDYRQETIHLLSNAERLIFKEDLGKKTAYGEFSAGALEIKRFVNWVTGYFYRKRKIISCRDEHSWSVDENLVYNATRLSERNSMEVLLLSHDRDIRKIIDEYSKKISIKKIKDVDIDHLGRFEEIYDFIPKR